jgi:hypothetical protein
MNKTLTFPCCDTNQILAIYLSIFIIAMIGVIITCLCKKDRHRSTYLPIE